jgi:hypothetical protein
VENAEGEVDRAEVVEETDMDRAMVESAVAVSGVIVCDGACAVPGGWWSGVGQYES